MAHIPVRVSHSILRLNRKDHFELLGSTLTLPGSTVAVHVDLNHVEVAVTASDMDHLELTPSDAVKLGIHPKVLVNKPTVDFLRIRMTVRKAYHELVFSGRLSVTPRRLRLNAIDRQHLESKNVSARSHEARETVFDDLVVESTGGISYLEITQEEADNAFLKENDLVELIPSAGKRSPRVDMVLPERFLPTSHRDQRRPLITEKDVWQAIRLRKKIWIVKSALVTPAARELGNRHAVFEFEL